MEKNLTPRILAAAKEFKISKSELVDFLFDKGFDVTSYKPNDRLSPSMYMVLSSEFGSRIDTKAITQATQHKELEEKVISLKHIHKRYVVSPGRLKGLLEKYGVKYPSKKNEYITQAIYNFLLEDFKRLNIAERKTPKSLQLKKFLKSIRTITFSPKKVKRNEVKHNQYTANLNSHPITIEIGWENIIFDDYQIRVNYNDRISVPYLYKDSKKSYKYLRKYILNCNFEPLKVTFYKNEIKKVENIERLNEVIKILKVRQEFLDKYKAEETVSAKSILDHLGSVSIDTIKQIAKAKSVDNCIEYLCDLHDHSEKIIPALEVIRRGNVTIEEDTFIFTVKNESQVYLIWESTLKGRATYIFKTTSEHLVDQLQLIFDYISSELRAKRMKLRSKDDEVNEVSYYGFITHINFEAWKSKIANILSNGKQN